MLPSVGKNLERAELPEEIVPVVLDPIFRELVAFKSADDDYGPLRLAAGCRNSFPLLALRGVPGSSPHALSAEKKRSCNV
jgi:hypothetical protein